MIHSSKLRQPQYPALRRLRRDMLVRALYGKAPEIVVIRAAENYLRTFKPSWRMTYHHYKMKLPGWLLWCISADWREVCRDPPTNEDFEETLRQAAKFTAKTACASAADGLDSTRPSNPSPQPGGPRA